MVVQGGDNTAIINETFYKDPIEVWVNDVKYDSCKKTCDLPEGLNKVTLVFEDGMTSTQNMFLFLDSIIEADVSEFDGSKVTTMHSMFRECNYVKKINFGEFNTSSVEDMGYLFEKCYKLESINISHFDTTSVRKMNYMFSWCDKLVSMDLSHFKTPKLEEMEDILSYCHALLYANLSSFDTSNVKLMKGIFYASDSLKYIDLQNFNGSSVTNFRYAFGWVKRVSFINMRKFKIEAVNNVELFETFIEVPYYAKLCIKDSYTKNYVTQGYSINFDCSGLCFQKNIDVNYQSGISCKCNINNKYEFIKKCYDECPGNNESMEYDNYICEGPVGENYYLNEEEEMFRKCYITCKNCSKAGDEINNNCDGCISNFRFLDDLSATPNNCYEICQYYYYFNETNQYVCTPTESCPTKYSKLILPKKKCIDDCTKDEDNYKYDYKNNCLKQCPSNTKTYEKENKCLDECDENLFEYNNECYDDCPDGTFRALQTRKVCLNTVPENYYYDNNDKIYKECYNSCKKCIQAGNEEEHNCDVCINNYIFLNDALVPSKNCYLQCDHYYYFDNTAQYACTSSNKCPSLYKNLIESKKKCIDDCKKDNKYKYEYNTNCLEQCPSDTKIYEQEKKCLDECNDNLFEYNNQCYNYCPEGTHRIFQTRNKCVNTVPENYYLDTNDNIYKECYSLCKKCGQAGNVANHNCDECINNYKFLNDPSAINNNCYQNCDYNYYFDETNQYTCTLTESCPSPYTKLIFLKHKCIDDCKKDNENKYEYNTNCLEQCPSDTKIYEQEKKCLDECNENQFEYNNQCYNDCPEGTFRALQNRKVCLNSVPEDYYLDTNDDNIYKKCYNLCIKRNQAGTETNHNCEECIEEVTTIVDKSIDIKETSLNTGYINNCDITSFFNNGCKISPQISSEHKQNFVEEIITKIKDGSLESLITSVVKEDKNIIIENEEEIYSIGTLDNQNINETKTLIDLGDCEKELRSVYNITEEEKILIFKIEKYIPGYKIPILGYELFTQNGEINLNLDYCENIKTNTYISVDIDKKEVFKYDPNNEYYNDRCNQYTTENGIDITLYDRKNEYNENNMSLCEKNCEYKGYDINNKIVECECNIKNIKNFLEDKKQLLNEFKSVKKIMNLDVIKCYKTLFTFQGLKNNIGSYTMFSLFLITIICSIYFIIKGYTFLISQIKLVIKFDAKLKLKTKTKKEKVENDKEDKDNKNKSRNNLIQFQDENLINRNRNNNMLTLNNVNDNNKNNKINKKKKKKKSKKKKKLNNEKDINLNDYEMNSLDYDKALKYDNRSIFECYLSLIKTKQIIIFTFLIKSDYNSRIIKIILFLLSFSFNYATNALFFTDSTIHQIYVDHGIYDFLYQLPQIIYSTIISTLIDTVISYLSLTEESISELKQKKSKEKINGLKNLIKCIFIKFIFFFILNFLFLGFMWYYLSTFCAVYKNTQIFLLKDTLISYLTSLVYPFLYNFIPCIFRILALKGKSKDRNCLYKISQFLQIF